jgi:hypothetical protein
MPTLLIVCAPNSGRASSSSTESAGAPRAAPPPHDPSQFPGAEACMNLAVPLWGR